MKYSRVISIAMLTAALTAVGAVSPAFADQPSLATTTDTTATTTVATTTAQTGGQAVPSGTPACGVTADDVASIRAASENGLLAELDARRTLLARVITCAKTGAESLLSELQGISLEDVPAGDASEAAAIKSQLAGKINGAATYYDLELQKVPTAGIAGTKAIASEVLAWRASNYEPLAENVANFELWTTSQPLITAASNRLQGVANLVAYFEQAGPDNALQADLSAAQSLLQSAKDADKAAEDAFAKSLPPDQVRADIQGMLQPLSATYQKFFDIADAIQTLLPSSK